MHNLGVARDDGNTGIGGGQCHRFRKRPQRIDLKTLLDDRAAGEVKRNSPANRQIIDGATDGELADVAAWEKQRIDDIGIGGEGQPVAKP